MGWINPTLYKHPEAFNDITSGGALGCGDKNIGFNATTGYDLGSGLGSPKFAACETSIGTSFLLPEPCSAFHSELTHFFFTSSSHALAVLQAFGV